MLARLWRNFGPVVVVTALIAAVSFLPPDTSLREIRRNGTLRACVPEAYPPLVTDDPDRPGIDVELLQAVADELDVDLSLNRISAIGRDFNPRNWGVTRGHCEVIAGGVIDAPLTRSFLTTGPAYAETGWAAVASGDVPDLSGRSIAVLTQVSGFDRIELASFLRGIGARPLIVHRREEFAAAIERGEAAAGVTEALLASDIAARQGWSREMLPLPRYAVTFGLWKGDLTLKRAMERAFRNLRREGSIDVILADYLGDQA